MTHTVELVLDARSLHGEGPIWDAPSQRLYWVNISEGEVHIFDPAAKTDRTIQVGQPVGTIVPRRSGGVMLALKHGFASLDLDTEALTMFDDPEADKPRNRFNDGKCDPAGRFWAGTMSDGEPTIHGAGSLYMLDANHQVTRRLADVSISNGLAWSVDKTTMYFIDSLAYTVDAFDYDDATGEIGNRRAVVRILADTGIADGMTLDEEGKLWVAQWGGSRVCRWDPANGRLLETIEVPAANASACAFGGPNLDELYITTANIGLSPATLAKQPHTGGIFKVKPGVRGLPAFAYAG